MSVNKKKIYLVGILILFSVSFVVSFDFPTDEITVTTLTGNLTNLSQMGDVNIPSPSNNNVLTWNSATGVWEDMSAQAVGDTNETARFDNLTAIDCGSGFVVKGVFNNGTVNCVADADSGSSNPFDQVLNTTSNVTFNNITITENLDLGGNITLGQKITFAFNEFIDNIVNGWIRINGGLNVTGQSEFNGNMSLENNSIKEILSTHYDVAGCTEETVGTFCYDVEHDTMKFATESGQILQMNQETTLPSKNVEGSVVLDGSIVYIMGATGTNPNFMLARADNLSTSGLVGVVTRDCNNNQICPVVFFGEIHGFDTSSFSIGDHLYLSETEAGNFTATPPEFPNVPIWVATAVRIHANEGNIFVFPRMDSANGITINSLGLVGDIIQTDYKIRSQEGHANLNGKNVFTLIMNGSTGVEVPHVVFQPGGNGQAGIWTRSGIVVPENLVCLNNTNMTDAQCWADAGGFSWNINDFNTTNTEGADWGITGELEVIKDLDVHGNITADWIKGTNLNITGTSYLGDLIIDADNITVNNILNKSDTGVRIWSSLYVNEKIGIGITNPSAELEVIGTTKFTGSFTTIGSTATDSMLNLGTGAQALINTSINKFQIRNWDGGEYQNVFFADGGNVGINTTTPQNKLNVVGDLNVTGTSYLGNVVIESDNVTTNNIISRDGNINIFSAIGTLIAKFFDSGNLSVEGNVTANEFFGDIEADFVKIALGGGSPTIDQMQEYLDNTGSSGFFLGGELSDGGSGTLDVAAGSGFIRTTNDANAELQSFKWSASAGIAVTDNTTQYVYVDDSGVISLNTNEFLETPDLIQIGVVTKENGDTDHVFKLGVRLEESIGEAGRFIRRVHGIERNNRLGGLILGQSGDANRDITMTAGQLEWGRTSYTISSFDTSGADTFRTYSAGGLEDATASEWDNAFYDNAGTLTAIPNNKWANLFFFLEPDNHIDMVYGRSSFNTQAIAELEGVPSTSLPSRISETSILLGRFTFQEGTNTATISSAFDTLFANAGVTDHGNLAGLTDDDHTQYSIGDGSRISGFGNFTTLNVTGLYFGNGSQLTDITLTESDPFWLPNYTNQIADPCSPNFVTGIFTNGTFQCGVASSTDATWVENYSISSNLTLWTTTFNQTTNDSITNFINNNNDSVNNNILDTNSTQSSWVDLFFVRFTEIVDQVGNWTLDKVNYYTISEVEGVINNGTYIIDSVLNNGTYTGISEATLNNGTYIIDSVLNNGTYTGISEATLNNGTYVIDLVLNNGTYETTDIEIWSIAGNGTLIEENTLNNGTYVIDLVLNNGTYIIDSVLNNGTYIIDLILNNGTYSVVDTDTFVLNFTDFKNKVFWGDVNNGTIVGSGNTTEEIQDAVGSGFGDGLTYDDTNGFFNHSDTGAASNSSNSGNTFIQDIGFDKFGHTIDSIVTGVVDIITSLQGFFDQEEQLNTTGSPTFVNLTLTGNLSFDGELLPDGSVCANGEILKKTADNNWDCSADDSSSYDLNITSESGSGVITDAEVLGINGAGIITTSISGNNYTITGSAHITDTSASVDCSGTNVLLGNGTCIETVLLDVFVNTAGDTMTGDLNMSSANVTITSDIGRYCINQACTSYIYNNGTHSIWK